MSLVSSFCAWSQTFVLSFLPIPLAVDTVASDYALPAIGARSGLCNHPKQADFYMTFLIENFAIKNAMFNLNENNRFVMAQHPSDMRAGVNKLCGQVRSVGLEPTNGDVYVFVGTSRKLMKLLHWERGGYTMYYKRLEQGRFHPLIFLRQGIGFRSMRWDELVLLMEGISPKVARRRRYMIEEKTASEEENNRRKIWLSR